MDILDKKSDEELIKSLLAEVAKAKSEIKCATNDIEKASNRLSFSIVLINTILARLTEK